MRYPLLSLSMLLLVAGVAEAQIALGRKSKVDEDAASRILVATPFLEESRNPGDAVKVGNALRNRMSDLLGSKFTVIPRNLINVALQRFGYQPDDALPVAIVPNLASQVKAGITVVTVLSALPGGNYAIWAEVTGLAAPVEVSFAQAEGQDLEALGVALAEALKSRMF